MQFNLAQVICLIGAFQALQLCLSILFLGLSNRKANGLLALTIGIMGLLLFLGFYRFGSQELSQFRYAVVHLWGTLAMLVAPLSYLYVRTSVGTYQLTPLSWLHFLPSFIHLCLIIPLVFMNSEARESTISHYLSLELYRSFIPGIRIGVLQAMIYWGACFFWVRRLEQHIHNTASFDDQLILRWLKLFTLMLVVLLFMLGLGRLIAFSQIELVGVVCFTLFLTAVQISALVRPELFGGLAPVLKLPNPPTQPQDAAQKYQHSQLDEARQQKIAQKLETYFEKQTPFLKEDLTLADVCQELGFSRSHVSQTINSCFEKSFHDFVNDYRIAYAKTWLRDETKAHLSIDGIALEAGFRSRSSFYSAFKKRVGLTPTAWRKSPQSK